MTGKLKRVHSNVSNQFVMWPLRQGMSFKLYEVVFIQYCSTIFLCFPSKRYRFENRNTCLNYLLTTVSISVGSTIKLKFWDNENGSRALMLLYAYKEPTFHAWLTTYDHYLPNSFVLVSIIWSYRIHSIFFSFLEIPFKNSGILVSKTIFYVKHLRI